MESKEPKYKLTYLNGRGLAEFSRLIFAYAEVDYVDERLEIEEWAKMKTHMFNRLPILRFDGHEIRESRAITRFLAKEFGLTGANNIESAKCDMLVDEFYDIYPELSKWRSEEVSAFSKKELKRDFFSPVYVEFLGRYSHLLSLRKNTTEHHFVGDKLTWADIVLAHGFWDLMRVMEDSVPTSFYKTGKRHLIVEFVEQILNLPSLKKWIDKRPKTNF